MRITRDVRDAKRNLARTRSAQIRASAFFWAPDHRQLATAETARQTLLSALHDGLKALA